MIRQITKYEEIDPRKLMDLYAEGNRENAAELYPELPEETARRKVEQGFLEMIETLFLPTPGNTYWVLEEDGIWISALRLYTVEKGLYYIEALETRPDARRNGYASGLLQHVVEEQKKQGPFRLCDCVSKENTASLKTHEKCGFQIVRETGLNYLTGEENPYCYGLEYVWR